MIEPVLHGLVVGPKLGVSIRTSAQVLPTESLEEALDPIVFDGRCSLEVKGYDYRHGVLK